MNIVGYGYCCVIQCEGANNHYIMSGSLCEGVSDLYVCYRFEYTVRRTTQTFSSSDVSLSLSRRCCISNATILSFSTTSLLGQHSRWLIPSLLYYRTLLLWCHLHLTCVV